MNTYREYLRRVYRYANKFDFLLLFTCVAFFFVYCYSSLSQHWVFSSNAFDLGIYTQIVYLSFEQFPAISSLKGIPLLGDHFEPILILLSPIYRLFPDAAFLLIIQALFVVLSGYFLYRIVFDVSQHKYFSLILLVMYFCSVGIVRAILFDFHTTTLSVLPLSMMMYAWHFRRRWMYVLVVFFAILFKEDIPIFIVGLGLYQLIRGKYRWGLFSVVFGAVSFYLIKFQIMPRIWDQASHAYLSTSVLPLSDPRELFRLVMENPRSYLDVAQDNEEKVNTLYYLLWDYSFLPLLSPLTLFTVLPYLYLRFSTTYYEMWGLYFHHNANLEPFLCVAAAYGLLQLNTKRWLLTSVLVAVVVYRSFLPMGIVTAISESPRNYGIYSYISNELKNIPRGVAVSAQSPLVPHVANREKVYLFPEIYDAEYIVVDLALDPYPMSDTDIVIRLNRVLEDPQWELVVQRDSLYIFAKK